MGSRTPRLLNGAMICGAVQVLPPLVDLTNASWALLRVPWNGVFGDTIKSVKLYRSPLRGSTTMMLPMVCDRFLVSMMTLAWLQVAP